MLSSVEVCSLIIIIIYILLNIFCVKGWKSTLNKVNVSRVTLKKEVFITIVAPVRNEKENLPALFKCLENQSISKDKFEVLIINDHSDDGTEDLIKEYINHSSFNLKTINLDKETGKKFAIMHGVRKALGNLVVTIDADCKFDKDWLITIYQNHKIAGKDFYILPISNPIPKSFFETIQLLELHSLIGLGVATYGLDNPILCNGANLCFTKDCFNRVNGYDGNYYQASGDDIFLLQKVKNNPDLSIGIILEKEVVAITKPKSTAKELLHQRLRWASKTGIYKDWFTTIIGTVVLTTNLYLLVALLIGAYDYRLLINALILLILKTIVDFIFLFPVLKWFNLASHLKLLPLLEILYPFYMAIIPISALLINPTWKGRKIKNYQLESV